MSLPASVVKEDARLEAEVTSASEALAKHRWHWTLDETNPERVAIREYARQVARAESGIRAMAHGYADWVAQGGVRTITESIERARMGTETEAAADAVASARGLSFGHTRKDRPTEVRRVREIARERAEKRGTSIEEEAPRIAESIVKAEQAAARIKETRKERLGLRYVEMERKLDSVKRQLVEAVNLAHDINWGDEEKELLSSSLDNIKALLNLIDVAFVGAADVDWDTELAKLTGDEST